MASFQPTSIASPVAARDRSLDDADDAQVEAAAVDRSGPSRTSPTREAEPLGQRGRDDRRAARRRARRAPHPVAGDERSRPSAARSAPTTAAASVRVALDGDVERGDRADPGDARDGAGQVLGDALVGGDRADRGQRRASPGTTSAIQAAAAARACWPTPPSATIIASPMVRPPRVSVVRLRSRTTELRASRSSNRKTAANGAPATRAMAGRTNGMQQRGDEQDRVDDERLDDAARRRRRAAGRARRRARRRRRRRPASAAGRAAPPGDRAAA